MSLLKYIERIKRMDDLIRRKSTGRVDDFAEKLGISRSQLFQDLKELKELGAPIEFCSISKSYFYTKTCDPSLNFLFQADSIRGGSDNVINGSDKSINWQSSPAWLDSDYINLANAGL